MSDSINNVDTNSQQVLITNNGMSNCPPDSNMFDLEMFSSLLNSLIQTFMPSEQNSFDLRVNDNPRKNIHIEVIFHKPNLVGLLLGQNKENARCILQWVRNQQAYKHDRYVVLTTVEPDGVRQDHTNRAVSSIRRKYRDKNERVPHHIYLRSGRKYRLIDGVEQFIDGQPTSS